MPTSLLDDLLGNEEKKNNQVAKTQTSAVNPETCQDKLSGIIAETDDFSIAESTLDREYTLVTYQVSNDQIISPEFGVIPPGLQIQQGDSASYEHLWEYVRDVVPVAYRQEITSFHIFTDGVGGTLGAVRKADSPEEWVLEMDIQDANNYFDLSTTLVHEVTHLMTLNTSQVVTDWAVFNDPDDALAFERGAASCENYFTFEGCSYPDSYLNRFFERFWVDIYDQWLDSYKGTDQHDPNNRFQNFYSQYPDRFLTDYAATSPEEDIAESFMYFIFSTAPMGDTTAAEKVLFFYEFPELVDIRQQMMAGLCKYAP